MRHDPEPTTLEMPSRASRVIPLLVAAAMTVACTDGEQRGAAGAPEPSASPPPASKDRGAHAHHDHEHEQLPAKPALRGESIFHLDSTFENQRGKAVKLDSLRGKVAVLAMVYTHCDNACPRIIADMRRIRKEIDEEAKAELELVLVSIDPARDTVQRLQSFGEETGLTKQGWTLLRGDESDVRELAAVFGVQYRETSETDFAHSNLISVLNREGEIAHQQHGLGVDPRETVAVVRNLLQDKTPF